jgi:hypothetical protein
VSEPGRGHPELRYEQRDVRPAAIVRFAIGLVLVIAVSSAALLGLFAVFAKQQQRHDPPPPPLARPTGDLPPVPRLQIAPVQDLEQVRAQEEKELNSYGWVDPRAGIARIPIDEAIRILAQRGLPQAAPSPAASPASPASPAPTAAPDGERR